MAFDQYSVDLRIVIENIFDLEWFYLNRQNNYVLVNYQADIMTW